MDLLLIYLEFVNVVAFLMYGMDKWKARKGKRRIPEKTLLGIATIGGSVGAFLGMYVFHHKTKKIKFYLGVPVIFLIQMGIAVCIYYYL